VTELGELLAARIEQNGPIGFDEFMEQALYHPKLGYYRRARDPFGTSGDFYTAEQLQPVFGILIAQRIRQLARALGDPADFTVVELGAGRQEMAEAFAEWRYVPVEIGSELPEAIRGVVFSNEFFDALPVQAVTYLRGAFREQRVTFGEGAFQWIEGPVVPEHTEAWLRSYYEPPQEGRWYEMPRLDSWIAKIAGALADGCVLTIDYGFLREESARFPRGTLMSYHRHTAVDDVLRDPGERDITAHVNFTAMMETGARCGLVTERFDTLASTLLAAGEADQFAAALGGESGELRRRMQLKTLLFGMGETFRVLLQRRVLNRSQMPEK
jgi:SAM-dependent MidA family methyltransferase